MAVFIELATEAFQANQSRMGTQGRTAGRAGTASARRPLRGLEIKEDTYALIRVVRADGSEIPLVDSSSSTGQSADYTNFILQMVQEARMEKHQIIQTFGEPYIFFFGEEPRFLDVQALLVDSFDFNWEAEWWENYDKYFRGTKLVEMGARCYLFYEDNIVEGYMLNAQSIKVSDQPLQVQLAFRFFITNYQNVSLIGNPNFPIRTEVRALLSRGTAEQAVRLPRDDAGLTRIPNDPTTGQPGAFDPNTGGYIFGSETPAPPGTGVAPVRDLIFANQDEWTGPYPTSPPLPTIPPLPNLSLDPRALAMLDIFEVRDLPLEMIQTAAFYGAAIADASILVGMGIGPSFGYGINGQPYDQAVVGARAGFEASASATASVTVAEGFGTSSAFGVSAGVGSSVAVSAGFSPLTARSLEQQRIARARAALHRGRQRPYGSLNAMYTVAGDPYSPVRLREQGGYFYNTPLPPGQAGNIASMGGFIGARTGVGVGVSASAGIGAGGGVLAVGRASAFSVTSVPGTFIAEGITAGVGLGGGFGAGAGVSVSVF